MHVIEFNHDSVALVAFRHVRSVLDLEPTLRAERIRRRGIRGRSGGTADNDTVAFMQTFGYLR